MTNISPTLRATLTALTMSLAVAGLHAASAPAPIHALASSDLMPVQIRNIAGQSTQGQVAVTPSTRAAVSALFNDLYAVGFRFENVSPMGEQAPPFETAVRAHRSFAFGLGEASGAYALAINPQANPVLSRSPLVLTPNTPAAPQHDSLMHAPSNSRNSAKGTRQKASATQAPEVLPFDAVYALNTGRNTLPGRITPEVEAIFQRHGFVRYTGSADRAYFGVFVYQGPESRPVPALSAARPQARVASTTSPKASAVSPPVISPLTEAMKASLIASGAWRKDCPVGLERLNVVEFSYRNTQGQTYRGSVIAADILGPSLAKIVQGMYSLGFPLEHPASAGEPKDPLHFGGTGAFNCRAITGGGGYSLHSYGTAIDINFGLNPYIGGYAIDHAQQRAQAHEVVPGDSDLRLFVRANKPAPESGYVEAIQNLMRENGYIVWGGDWSNRTDYMHFQTTAFLSFLFPYLDKTTGMGLLKLSVQYPQQFHRLDPDIYVTDLKKWVLLYQLYPTRFLSAFEKNLPEFNAQMSTDDFLLRLNQDLSANTR